jgi:hypothetical protein
VRAVFLALLSANLLFLAWARWIDTPRESGAQDVLSRLPRLQLVSESPPGPKPTSANQMSVNPASAMPEKVALRTPDPPSTCTSVGPFNDIARAARAAGLLTHRGFHLQQRAEEGETIEGYWVFVGGMQSDEEVNQVVERLEKSGFTDAHVMKNYSTNRRVSVGMFSTRERAEKRATAVQNMGLQPEVGERRFPGTVYWVDVALAGESGGKQQVVPGYALADIGRAKVGMQPCPAGLRPVELGVSEPTDDGDGVTSALRRTAVASAPTGH